MRARSLFLLAACVSAPALAQHQGHGAQPPAARPAPPPCPPQAAPHAGHGQAAPAPRSCAAQPAAAPDPHAGHAMSPSGAAPAPRAPSPHAGHATPAAPPATPAETGQALPSGPADPHAGHDMSAVPPPAAADPHAGHPMPSTPPQAAVDPHAGHATDAPAAMAAAPPVAPPPPEALSGPAHAADLAYDPADMARARAEERRVNGAVPQARFLIDRLEVATGEGRDAYVWDDVQFWYGGDIDRLWIKSQGEGEFGGALESAEVQALWSRAISPWFDVQAGARYDFAPDPRRAYLVLGLQGLAPYWFELDTALFVSNKGDVSARFEAEYDLRITQRLILQPQVEADFQLQDVPELRLGSGLSTAELGLRLRHEFFPARAPAVLAPYVGVSYERAFGDTAAFRRAAGERTGGWRLLLGVRTWF